MNSDESTRIASLTTGAIRTSTENVVKQIWAAVEAAEQKAREMRDAAEAFVAQFEKDTAALAENVNSHVIACQAAIDSFQGHELKITNGIDHDPNKPEPPLGGRTGTDILTEIREGRALR